MRLLASRSWLIVSIFSLFLISETALGETETKEEFPKPLTSANFKEELSKGLHVIDFYSPYCSHCKQLAPIWKEAWETFYEEGKKLNITFSQVNCITDGDLCSDESIEYWPTIRLYGPNGAIKNFPSNGKRAVENLLKFARTEAFDPANREITDLKSQSKTLTDTDFVNLLAGKGETPYLVSFWPTEFMKDTDVQGDFVDCAQCTLFQRTWRLVSARLIGHKIESGHINCMKYDTLCKELGFADLTEKDNRSEERNPRVALVLPNKMSNNLFIFNNDDFDINPYQYEDFASRIVHNNEAPETSFDNLINIMTKNFNFNKGEDTDVAQENIHVVFSYDPKTVVSEDFDVLEYLIEPLQNIPNVFLHKMKNSLIDVTKQGYKEVYNMINHDHSEPGKELNEKYFAMNTVTQLPTFFLFKDGDRIPSVYPGYSSTETRDDIQIMSWIKSHSKPLISEVTPSNFLNLLNFESDIYSTIVMLVADTSNKDFVLQSGKYLKDLNIAAYGYEDIRMQKMYDDISIERKDKQDYISELRSKGESTSKIVNAMRMIVSHTDNLKLLLSYYDISQYDEKLAWLGVNRLENQLNVGDVIIFDKREKLIYQFDSDGNPLNTDSPHKLRDVLLSTTMPDRTIASKLASFKMDLPSINGKSMFNFITGNKILLLSIILLAVLLVRGKHILKRYKTLKNYRSKRNYVGLLGKVDKHDFQD